MQMKIKAHKTNMKHNLINDINETYIISNIALKAIWELVVQHNNRTIVWC